jgi:hypothetical protein
MPPAGVPSGLQKKAPLAGGALKTWSRLSVGSLHCRRICREFAELVGRVGAHRRRARIAGTREGAHELYHRLPIWHLQGQYNVVVSGRHIGAEQLSA